MVMVMLLLRSQLTGGKYKPQFFLHAFQSATLNYTPQQKVNTFGVYDFASSVILLLMYVPAGLFWLEDLELCRSLFIGTVNTAAQLCEIHTEHTLVSYVLFECACKC